MLTVEEGSIGGFAAHVMQVRTIGGTLGSHSTVAILTALPELQFLALEGLLDGNLKFRPMTLPDRYIEHGTQVSILGGYFPQVNEKKRWSISLTFSSLLQAEQLAEAGLTASHIAGTALTVSGVKRDVPSMFTA